MLRYILYVVSRSNGRIWTGCRFHSLSSSPQMQHLPSNLTIWKEKCPFPPQNTKHIWTRGTWRWPDQKRYRASHRYVWHDCATNALRKEPQNSSVTPEKPCHLRKTRKSIPASSSTSTFYVPSYTKKFDMILAQSTSTTSHKPNKHLVETLHHGIAFISCWQWQPDTWSGACRDIQGSSNNKD